MSLGLVSCDRLAAARTFAPVASADVHRALGILAAAGCHTVLFSLGWGAAADVRPDWAALQHIDRIFVGGASDSVTVHIRDRTPQQFVAVPLPREGRTLADRAEVTQALPDRTWDGVAFLFGSELNAFKMNKNRTFDAPSGWDAYLDRERVEVFLNPCATYMRRWEMRLKRGFCSRQGRTTVSVWNRTSIGESALPWTVFHDGQQVWGAARPLSDEDERLSLAVVDLAALPEQSPLRKAEAGLTDGAPPAR